MKILAFSDTHGADLTSLPGFSELESGYGLILIAGDIMPLNVQRDLDGSRNYLYNEFVPQLEKLKEKTGAGMVLMVGGNHDFALDDRCDLSGLPSWFKILYNETYEYDGVRVFGSPYMGMARWAFYRTPESLRRIYESKIGQDVDIILTHCPPAGLPCSMQIRTKYANMDSLDRNNYFYDFGNKPLKNWLDDSYETDLTHVVCGHIHECLSRDFYVASTGYSVKNVSIKDESYEVYSTFTSFSI